MNEIIYRKNTITNADIVSGNCLLSHSTVGESLATDTIDFRLWSDTGLGKVDADFITAESQNIEMADGAIFRCFVEEDYTNFVPGDSLTYKKAGVPIGKFYLRDVKRAGKHAYDFYGVSAVGILGDTLHYGGIYTGQTVAEVAAELLEGIAYEIDPIVGEIKLYGWLPIATKRDNLQQITIATAVAVKTKPDGTLLLTALTSDVKGVFGTSRTIIGGNVTIDTPYTAVQVTEHHYSTTEEEITLFSESSIQTEFLKFNEPIHSLTVTGGTIVASGANYAIIECNGLTEVKGKKYLHTTRTVTRGTVDGLPSDKVYSVTNATLITSLNSSGIAQKLFEAHTKPKTIQANVFYGSEKAGDVVSVINPYTEEMENGFLERQEINIGKTLMANSDFLIDFIPSGAVTGYKNRVVLTGTGSWTAPEGVTEIRAVLIGGGQGGTAGENGKNGSSGTGAADRKRGAGGKGGPGGDGGDGGKVFEATLPVTPGQTISATVGLGGSGGQSDGTAGEHGTETIFGTVSSGLGVVGEYVDVMTAGRFATTGLSGLSGGDGGGPDDPYGDGDDVIGPDGSRYQGGWGGAPVSMGLSSGGEATAGGGGGGGAAVEANGSAGGDGTASYNAGKGFVSGGDGGDGGDASGVDNATIFGAGGDGGHGGGGGGGGGNAYHPLPQYSSQGAGGAKGLGGPGGKGGDGCIIIYY